MVTSSEALSELSSAVRRSTYVPSSENAAVVAGRVGVAET